MPGESRISWPADINDCQRIAFIWDEGDIAVQLNVV